MALFVVSVAGKSTNIYIQGDVCLTEAGECGGADLGLTFAMIAFALGALCACCCSCGYAPMWKQKAPRTRDVATQAPTTYRRDLATSRFCLLRDYEHGAWVIVE